MNQLLRKTAIGFLAIGALALGFEAQAQTQNVQPIRRATYSAAIAALTPAASATDFFTITGSATKVIWVHKLSCSGASTAAAIANLSIVKRSTANSAGTATTPTVVPYDSLNTAGSAVVRAYTANPTTGTLVGLMSTVRMPTDAATTTASPTDPGSVLLQFGLVWTQPIVLRGTAQVLALNNGGATFATGTSLSCAVEWSE